MLKQRLTYEILGGTVLSFDLHNGYTVVAIASWIFDKEKYEITLYLKENTMDLLDLMQDAEKVEFESDKASLKLDITKYVATLLSEGFFNKYIERYEYTAKCLDKGNAIFCGEDDE